MINQSDYRRSGIFIEERNNSGLDTTPAQEAVVNFVPGFSKKGTVFNRPILVRTKRDRATYFGDIDRFLENKGSFFHRTIDVALQTAPIFAMNILKTNSLDQLNYQSISLSAQYDNSVLKTQQYDDFFNKAGFWTRDTDSFLFFAGDNEKMMHLTNVSDKKITTFMFKADVPQFNITAEEWYGGRDAVPSFMNPSDFISDYMVRVIVISGDWSNYPTLAADTKWSQFFNASGLRKTQVDNFISTSGVSTLGDYTGSLIPYFRDQQNNQGNNIFIETLINLNTDTTGLFCAFDIDKVETDLPNGNIDIIGQTLVDLDKSKVNFMSYQETIEEVDGYESLDNDRLGNVSSLVTSPNVNGYVNGLAFGSTSATNVTFTSATGIGVINNTVLNLVTISFTITPTTVGAHRIDTYYIDNDGIIKEAIGVEVPTANTPQPPANFGDDVIVLGYTDIDNSGFLNYTAISVDNGGFVDFDLNNEVILTGNGSINNFRMEFVGTGNTNKSDYANYRLLKRYNEIITNLVIGKSIIFSPINNDKIDLTNAIITDNYSATDGVDKYFEITVEAGIDIFTAVLGHVYFFIDSAFEMGTEGLTTSTSGTLANHGVIGLDSEFYLDFYNGNINSGDYFYTSYTPEEITFVNYTNLANPAAIGSYIILPSIVASTTFGLPTANQGTNEKFFIESHPVNTGLFSLQSAHAAAGDPEFDALTADGLLPGGFVAYKVLEPVVTYTPAAGETTIVSNFNEKVYLKMYTIGSELTVDFMADNALTIPFTITTLATNADIRVYSGEAAYEQTLEVEIHPSYTITDTKFLVDAVRYPEVKVGDYVKAFVDTNTLQPGEYPKKFARILKKTPWSGNTANNVQYSELTVDIKVDIQNYNGDYQTTRYTNIEDYIDTYKAITLNGFTVQQTSIPDGTEQRQSEILDTIGVNTNLFNAITNKNKFNFRYLIDSFGLGLTEFSKQQLADITGKRKNCIGFLNMPSARNFINSSSPAFINDDGTLNLEFVKNGADLEKNPPFLYSFAQGSGTCDGRDTVGYFFPYVTVNDNGRPLEFPPASYVCNTYMRKINSPVAGTYNFTVAAGIEDGIVRGVANTEMDFTNNDLEQLYAMGANPITYVKNIGFNILTEFTALRTPVSALSYLHVREILIDLENDLFAMLLKYQYKFNQPAVRARIKREADTICQKYLDRGALYAYENVIDDTNNTPILIDNQFGLLETYIEPVKAMEKIVNIINVEATGSIGASTGFGN